MKDFKKICMIGFFAATISGGCGKQGNVSLPVQNIPEETSEAMENSTVSDSAGTSECENSSSGQTVSDTTAESESEDIDLVLDILTHVQLEAGAGELSPSSLFETYTGQQVDFQTTLTKDQLAAANSAYEIEVIYMGQTVPITVEITDTTPPSIDGVQPLFVDAGGTLSYKKGIVLSDNASGDIILEIDSSSVNSNIPGTYPLYYTATDAAGNQSAAETTVTVNEVTPPSEEDANALADALIAQIITPEMNQFDTAYALWSWCRNNIHYAAAATVYDSIPEGAYQGLNGKSGDCYIYYATYTLLLTRCGIETQCVTRSGGSSAHWWNLVNTGNGWYHCDASPLRKGDPYVCFMQTDSQLQAYNEAHPERPDYYSFDKSLYPERETTVIYGEDPAVSTDPEQ